MPTVSEIARATARKCAEEGKRKPSSGEDTGPSAVAGQPMEVEESSEAARLPMRTPSPSPRSESAPGERTPLPDDEDLNPESMVKGH